MRNFIILFLNLSLWAGTVNFKGHKLSTIKIGRDEYVSLNSIASLYNVKVSYEKRWERYRVRVDKREIIFIPDNPVVLINGEGKNFPLPVKRMGKTVFIPVYFIDDIFPDIPERRRPKKIKLIVIDPGHGGKDPGAISRGGLEEKFCNLDIAKRVKEKIEKRLGIKVVMTRDRDIFIPLSERAQIANRLHADLFISIHNNSCNNSRLRGMETYFLSVARTSWARAVEARENAAIRFELPDTSLAYLRTVDLILHDLAQNEFLKESEDLAACIQEETAPLIRIPNRGLNQAGFYVLRGAFMPAVLVECAFLSNPTEEALLRKGSFRDKIAEGIYRGVKRFVRNYEKKLSGR